MRKAKLLILTLSLIFGFTGTYRFSPYLPVAGIDVMTQKAWWGGIYPEYCLPGAMELIGTEYSTDDERYRKLSEDKTELPVKIRFKYLTFFNDMGGSHE